jgi:hypothetical protein
MRKQFIFVSLFVIFCQYSNVFCQKLPVLDLSSAIEHPTSITLSDFIESVTYIPLETSDDALVDQNPKVFVTKDYILTVKYDKCLLFNRKNGLFIREIGSKGRGPGEFQFTKGFFNEYLPCVYFTGWNGNLIKYTMDGVFRGNIRIPGYNDSFDSPTYPMNYSYINDTLIACDLLIGLGTETKSMLIFNENGKLLKAVPNYNILKIKQRNVFTTGEGNFYRFNDNLFYQNKYNDTVFQVSVDGKTPYIVIDRGKYSPPFESKWGPIENRVQSGFISTFRYAENVRFMMFYFNLRGDHYFSLYDKSVKSLKVAHNPAGIKNDVDEFLDLSFSYLNSEGELVSYIDAVDIINWIEENPKKFKELKTELQFLQDIEITDNPVVVIAKLKK